MKEGLQTFLEMTIDYNANRLDFWIQRASRLVKGSPLRLSSLESLSSELERRCHLGSRTASDKSIPAMVESLLLKIRH
jgi:hypothetical protein